MGSETMWILRAVRIADLNALHDMVAASTRGLTSLQLTLDQLHDRIEHSEFAFSRSGPSPQGEPYVLVLVNQQTGEMAGTSTVYAKSGGYQPFYAYRLIETEHISAQLGLRQIRQSLRLTRIHDGPTEIGSLFLRGAYRGHGFGRWLSMARFALIAMRPHRFADRVIAEMRGKATADGKVPFFEALAG
ncbi:MAG: arginine N-succinyltransferase, partial [Novipirellula sp. JB048]